MERSEAAAPGARPLLVISPHLDDAVLSLGRALAAAPGSIVATVCTASLPDASAVTEIDARAGFATSGQCMAARLREDEAALERLGAHQVLLDLLDRQYGWQPFRPVVDALSEVVARSGPGRRICGPIGLIHPDHRMVARAFLVALAATDAPEAWLYEEVPYRAEVRRTVIGRRLLRARRRGWRVEEGCFADGDDTVAQAALACYASQLPLLAHRRLDAPARVWRLSRPQTEAITISSPLDGRSPSARPAK